MISVRTLLPGDTVMATLTASQEAGNSLYEQDFYAWTQQQARLLRERRWDDLDLENLIDEIESVGGSNKREIENRLTVLMAHLLKWAYQPGIRSASWRATINEQRRRIHLILRDSPSLKKYPALIFADQHLGARLEAASETGIAFELFPEQCPFAIEQALDDNFLPDEPGLIGQKP
jgi:hypothetical protein